MINFFKKQKDDLENNEDAVIKTGEIKTEEVKAEESKTSEAKTKECSPEQINVDEKKSNTINYDDFAKVEMKVGEIVSAEKVENADRLLKLKVKFADEERQIVSGIAEYFNPEELIGTKCPFVTNLEPREIRGVESQGMILAAKDSDGSFSLLPVSAKILPGTRLS